MSIVGVLAAATVAIIAPPLVIVPVIMPGPPTPASAMSPHSPALFGTPGGPVAMQPLPRLFSPMDYPAAALRAGAQGTTAVALTIAPNGRVSDCLIETSSGSSDLDAATCRILASRSRFSPARDALGRPVEGAVRTRITWTIPRPPSKTI